MDPLFIALVTFLHVLVFVYWLGGDLGVFALSGTVTDESAPISDRQFAVTKLLALDMAPRYALLLTLPTGLATAHHVGWIQVSSALMITVWIVALAWIALVIKLHHGATEGLRKLDLGLRITLAIGLPAWAALTPIPLFLAIKCGLLATAVVLGLIVRQCLKPLGPGLAALAEGDTATANPLIRASIGRSRLPVIGIWLIIAAAAFMGLWKPL